MRETFCFVVMPFRPELNYFFPFLKKYLEEKYKIRVERGDSHVLTKELMKEISDQISAASFLLADITGSNANVFFELGIAHATGKPVIFLTQDNPKDKDTPVDIRQFEFIQYELGRADSAMTRLHAKSFTPVSLVPRRRTAPQLDDTVRLARFLLPKILQDATDLNVMQRVTLWFEKRDSSTP